MAVAIFPALAIGGAIFRPPGVGARGGWVFTAVAMSIVTAIWMGASIDPLMHRLTRRRGDHTSP